MFHPLGRYKPYYDCMTIIINNAQEIRTIKLTSSFSILGEIGSLKETILAIYTSVYYHMVLGIEVELILMVF